MKHHIFSQADTYKLAICMKPSAFQKTAIQNTYVDPMISMGLGEDVIAVTLSQGDNGKPTATQIKEYLAELLPGLNELGVQTLYVCDGSYFKVLARQTKAEPHHGYVLPCAISGYEHMKVVLGIGYPQLVYQPTLQDKLTASLQTVVNHFNGSYVEPGSNIFGNVRYPKTVDEIKQELRVLLDAETLACDIEAFSLKVHKAGIATIAFATSQRDGVAFAVDYNANPLASDTNIRILNGTVKYLLREFFEHYTGSLIFHNATYDVKVLIYELWMDDPLDNEGLLKGLEVMTRHLEDTKVIAYLATNSTAGNTLGLKPLAHDYAGNYAVEHINDVSKIPLDNLLEYNLIDALCTRYVYDKFTPMMQADNQEGIYRDLMLPSLKLILQIELTGMPIDLVRVAQVKAELMQQQEAHLAVLTQSPTILRYNGVLQQQAMELANSKLKKKQHPIEHFSDVVFNPNSNQQLAGLLYEEFGLPVMDTTDTGQPATGSDTLKKLLNQTTDPEALSILNALVGYSGVNKILTAFIPSFEAAVLKKDGWHYIHGCFHIGGTVSGRLSSSDPNLQQIPSNSDHGKLIKTCFRAPKGWLFCGADFNSLEDYISALTTKDPNKLGVYLSGFDGHCLRAAYYFRDELPHIDLTDPKSVNSIKDTHPKLRQDSKGPTFALTYAGTWSTLVNNLGWDVEKAKQVEAQYHELYKVSDQYVQSKLAQAAKDGYVDVAFGLRVRTPLIKQVLWGGKGRIPNEAAAEGRTAGNALGQSYGLLNNRAAVAFMEKVRSSPFKHQIKPVALIHDAIYILVEDDVDAMEFANTHLIKEMQWQDLPEIQHPTVKLGAALDIYWPNWAKPITLPNGASKQDIKSICSQKVSSINQP